MYEGKKVIIRSQSAGVFFGTLKEETPEYAILEKFRKIHHWEGACAVEQIAIDGITNHKGSRLTIVVEEGMVSNPIQILPCTDKAIENLEEAPEWRV